MSLYPVCVCLFVYVVVLLRFVVFCVFVFVLLFFLCSFVLFRYSFGVMFRSATVCCSVVSVGRVGVMVLCGVSWCCGGGVRVWLCVVLVCCVC